VFREGTFADLELLDQWEQTEPVHMTEWVRPHELLCWPLGGYGGEGAVEMRNNGDVPAGTGQGAREETECVVDEIADNHFKDLRGESGSGKWTHRRSLRVSAPRANPSDSG